MLNDYEIEMRQRVTRIESRLCRIADGLNIPTADPAKSLKVMHVDPDSADLTTEVVDIGLSSIIRFLTKEGIQVRVARVYFENKLVAQVYPNGGQ